MRSWLRRGWDSPVFRLWFVSLGLVPLGILGFSVLMLGPDRIFLYSEVCSASFRSLAAMALMALALPFLVCPAVIFRLRPAPRRDEEFSRGAWAEDIQEWGFGYVLVLSVAAFLSAYLILGPGFWCGAFG